MKILFVIPGIGNSGGAEVSLAQICRGLVLKGFNVSIITLTNRKGLENNFKELGIEINFFPFEGKTWVSKIFGFRKLVLKLNPDIIHSTLFEADILVRLSFVGSKIKLLTTWASTNYSIERRLDTKIPWFKIQLIRLIDSLSAKISNSYFHAVTSGVAEQGINALRVSRIRVYVVERCRERKSLGYRSLDRYYAIRKELGIQDNVKMITSVARHVHVKGLDILIEAFALLNQTRRDCMLFIAGETSAYTKELEKIIDYHCLQGKIIFLGVRHDIPDLLCGSDVFVLASRYEGAAGSIIEAMALEVPIIATKINGTKGIVIDNHNSLVVKPRDPKAIADSINILLDNTKLSQELVKNSLELYNQKFTCDKVLEKTINMYNSIFNS